MAIVKTTPREMGGPDNDDSKEVAKPVDRTRSVVNQGGQPLTRPSRTPGIVTRPQSSSTAPASPKDFVNDTMAELRRVDWPTKEERNAGTIVTIMLLVFFAVYILGLDTFIKFIFVALGILPPNTN